MREHRIASRVSSAGIDQTHVPSSCICDAFEVLSVHVLQAGVDHQVGELFSPLNVALCIKALNVEYTADSCLIIKHVNLYAMRMIAAVLEAVGKVIRNVVLTVVLSAPKSSTATDLLPCVLL